MKKTTLPTKTYAQQVAAANLKANGFGKNKSEAQRKSFRPELSSVVDTSDPVVMEGIRQKVFMDRYALRAKDGTHIESTPEEMWKRVAWGISQSEEKSKRQLWEKRFYDVMKGFKFVPGGRILSGAGTGYEVTYFNCLPPDQEILTPAGYKAIKDIQVGDLVITGKKRARRVNHVFVRDTKEPIYHIKPKKLGFDDVRLTGEHPVLAIRDEWVNKHRDRDGLKLKKEPQWIKASELKKDDFVAVGWDGELKLKEQIKLKDYLSEDFVSQDGYLTRQKLHKPVKDTLDLDQDFMLLAGTWLGDGCITHRAGTDIPVGIQITFNKTQANWANQIAAIIQDKFAIVPTVREDKWGQGLIQVRAESYVVGLFFKDLFGRYSYRKTIPQFLMQQPTDKVLPLVKGLFRSDGYLTESQIGIALSNKVLAVQLHQLLLRSGHFFSIFENNVKGGQHDTYRLTGGVTQARELSRYIYDEERTNTHHDQNYFLTYNDLHWVRIDSIQTTQYQGQVFDIEVEEDHSFITGGVVVSNCFVIPSPKDSRDGILDSLKQLVEIQSRSGGVGLNLSSLRPKGARVKKVNGVSSGPVTWAGLFSYATHDVVQQGGCFASDTMIMTHLGLVPIKEIMQQKRDWFAATHQGYKRITTKFDNGIKDIYEVKTAAGYNLKITSDHKILTADKDGHFYQKELKKFKVGEQVTMLLGDWRQDIPYTPLNTFTPAPLKFSYGRAKINLPQILDERLAFLIGVYDADGSKVRDEYSPYGKGLRIAVAANRPKDLQKIVSTLKDLFGLEPLIKPGDGALYNVVIYSREVNEFLALNGLLKKYSINVEVPQLIYSSPRSVVEAYLAGVFVGDGGNGGGKGGFRLTTVSKQYASQIQLLLLNLGIPSKINTQDRTAQGWKTLYTVTINGHKFMNRFYEMISLYSEKARDKDFSKRDATFNWPFNLTEKFLYLSGFQRTIARTNVHTSQKAVQFLTERMPYINEADRDDVAILSSCVSDKIVSIKPLGKEQVYDLEVENTHLLSGNGFYTSNSRRGATMLMLWDWHPDVEEFITVKQDLSKINGANLSVCVSDAFMEAVKRDADWDLVYPDLDDPHYDEWWNGELDEWKAKGGQVKVYKTVKAKEIWNLICEAAWRSAEPGLHFLERSNKRSNTWYFEKLAATNPCGEQPLGPWAVCNLGAMNLSAYVKDEQFDFAQFGEDTKVAMRLLDNVIDQTYYFFPENEKIAKDIRRTGLGIMGLADALIKMKLRYGGEESLPVVRKIFETLRDSAYEASADIAKEKGPFPKFDKEKYLQGYHIQNLPEDIKAKISKQGIRNAVLLTVAPTGTTSLVSGVSSGVEPVYEFSFLRRWRGGEEIIYHPLFDEWRKAHPDEAKPSYFVGANDLTPLEHVKVQAIAQEYIDSSISKTVNAPNSHTVDDVQTLYMAAYDMGLKGVTYMRDGSRQGVLERVEEKKPEKKVEAAVDPVVPKPVHRPMVLRGRTYRVTTPVGEGFITINRDENDAPYEVFITIAKGGSHVMADAEALGRMISLTLRYSGENRKEVARKIVSQLRGIGGSSHIGFGKERVTSLADAAGKVLAEDLSLNELEKPEQEPLKLEEAQENHSNGMAHTNGLGKPIETVVTEQLPMLQLDKPVQKSGDLCPECGNSTLISEEGCQKCYNCGYSKC